MEYKEKRLIKKVKKGDHQAFAELVDKYKNSVYSICLRMVGNSQEAEDLSQETFIRAYKHIDQFDTDRKFSTWIFRIATNLSIDFLRRKKPSVSLDAELPGTDGLELKEILASGEALPDELVVWSETERIVQYEIDRLREKYRSAIILKYIQGLSLKEISEILGVPIGTVKTRIHRGREILRKNITAIRGEE
ncbi:RNA polymerase sigma factor SigW [Sporolactobacillus sp. THM7-4]|nr:RNA polymerase sigma factor SigW [Sporolactobacillus sp. THM7-4]